MGQQLAKPKVAVVLGGGGIKSLGGIYLFERLEQLNVPIHLLGGCSGGALVCGQRSIGMDQLLWFKDFVLNEFNTDHINLNYRGLCRFLSSKYIDGSTSGTIFKPNKCLNLLKLLYGDRKFSDTQHHMIAMSTNFHTGESVAIHNGYLYEAMYASCAMLPFFPPIDLNGNLLCDGVYSKADASAMMVKKDADIIINVIFDDSTKKMESHDPLGFSLNFLRRCYQNYSNMERNVTSSLHNSQMITIPINFNGNIDFWQIDSIPLIMKKCEQTIEEYIPQIEQAVSEYNHVG